MAAPREESEQVIVPLEDSLCIEFYTAGLSLALYRESRVLDKFKAEKRRALIFNQFAR